VAKGLRRTHPDPNQDADVLPDDSTSSRDGNHATRFCVFKSG